MDLVCKFITAPVSVGGSPPFFDACQGPGPGRQVWTLTDEATVTCWPTPSPGFRTSFLSRLLPSLPLSLPKKPEKPWAEDWPSTVPLPCPGWTSRHTLSCPGWPWSWILIQVEGTPPLWCLIVAGLWNDTSAFIYLFRTSWFGLSDTANPPGMLTLSSKLQNLPGCIYLFI